eukprot:COSAG05_NODE_2337_length_3213_cov_3.423892_3_plen_66_part_00
MVPGIEIDRRFCAIYIYIYIHIYIYISYRYETLFILDQGTQGALPQRVFTDVLLARFNVSHEWYV